MNNFSSKKKHYRKNYKNPEASLLLYSYTIFSSIDPKYTLPPTKSTSVSSLD